MVNRKFDRLTVVARDMTAPTGRGTRTKWICDCSCGQRTSVWGGDLKTGNTKSCGCLRSDHSRWWAQNLNLTHGLTGSPTYKSWQAMRERCTNEKHEAFANYGGRGISVCASWLVSFESFFADMGTRPHGLTLNRRDNDGNYEPGNCRWASRSDQQRNKRPTPLTFEPHEIEQLRWLCPIYGQREVARFFETTRHTIQRAIHGKRAYEPR